MAALYRQSGIGGNGNGNVASDYVSVGIHGGWRHLHHRRLKPPPAYRISVGLFALTITLVLSISALFFYHILQSNVEISMHQAQDDGISTDADFLKNVTRTKASKYIKLGSGSFSRGRDSRDRGKDANMRDENEALRQTRDGSVENIHSIMKNIKRKSIFNGSHRGLYKEGERNELIMFEAKYKASLKNIKGSEDVLGDDHLSDTWDSSHLDLVEDEKQDVIEEADKDSSDLNSQETLPHPENASGQYNSKRTRPTEGQTAHRQIPEKRRPDSKKKPKNRKPPGACPMAIMNSTALLIEPPESKKFGIFSLQYTEKEEKPISKENWEPRFAGHQTLREREESFIARDQEIKCGFVNGPNGSSIAGFNLDEDDAKYISSCNIAVSSCIFGNSDRLRSPMGKTVSRFSKKNVCFVMFVDEVTLNTLSSEGHMPDTTGFIGLWKIVVVKDLPYSDMRRVGKIPKLLPHRLFPSARYSIWLDSKLRLQLDPLLILEYFLWRKGYEYAISNHYDRHCLWEEVAQNKKLNKYNHSVIDEQFVFYQSDGMRRFNQSDPDKLLPSNVPEGSFIVRAHTPMSNLFSCLWFNEVDRFTPRDQLSFAYTYHKLSKMNPGKPFYLHMFKDCERRKIAKLYRHRSKEKRASSHVDL